jgi:hypothetical protein
MPKVAPGTFLGAHAVGIYALARRLLDLLTEVLLQPLNAAAMPAVSRVQDDLRKVDKSTRLPVTSAGKRRSTLRTSIGIGLMRKPAGRSSAWPISDFPSNLNCCQLPHDL